MVFYFDLFIHSSDLKIILIILLGVIYIGSCDIPEKKREVFQELVSKPKNPHFVRNVSLCTRHKLVSLNIRFFNKSVFSSG